LRAEPSRNPARQAIARSFGATDILAERGEEATEKILQMTDGVGVDSALECVGTGQSMTTAFSIARVGSTVGAIGAPHDVVVPIETVIFRTSDSAAASRPYGATSQNCSTTSSKGTSTQVASSTTQPTSTASSRPTPR
jgi:threonine dehydrogenase-like Zn-dependent dehydrogenase